MLDQSLEREVEITAAIAKAEQKIARTKASVKAGVERAKKTKKIKEMLKANLPDVDPLVRDIETRRLLSLNFRQFTEKQDILGLLFH